MLRSSAITQARGYMAKIALKEQVPKNPTLMTLNIKLGKIIIKWYNIE